MNENLKREIIIDNYQNPFHKQEILNNEFIKANTNNESCIDNVYLYVKLKNNKIIDAYFSGEACAITTSATSIMIKNIIGKTIKEASIIMNNYYQMINECDYDKEILNELEVYDNISKQPSRKKCATLPFDTLKKVINIYNERESCNEK